MALPSRCFKCLNIDVILWLLTPNKTLTMSFYSLRRKISWLIKCPDESHQLLYLIFFFFLFFFFFQRSIFIASIHPPQSVLSPPRASFQLTPQSAKNKTKKKNNLRSPGPARCCWLFANSASVAAVKVVPYILFYHFGLLAFSVINPLLISGKAVCFLPWW